MTMTKYGSKDKQPVTTTSRSVKDFPGRKSFKSPKEALQSVRDSMERLHNITFGSKK